MAGLFELTLLSLGGALLVSVVVAGVVLSDYRQRRETYYTRPTMLGLIGGLLALAGGLFVADWAVGGWVAVGLTGWLLLEGGFWLLKKPLPQENPNPSGKRSRNRKN